MSERGDTDFLSDIQEAIRRIETYMVGLTDTAFMADFKTQDAVLRNLEIIGEATKNLSEELRSEYPEIPLSEENRHVLHQQHIYRHRSHRR